MFEEIEVEELEWMFGEMACEEIVEPDEDDDIPY
jgi:hypothetical protein